jgi:hypothetical protein
MEHYTARQIAEKANKSTSNIRSTIRKLGIIPIGEIMVTYVKAPVYSKEQMDLILNYRKEKEVNVIQQQVIRTYYIYESKMNYDPTI